MRPRSWKSRREPPAARRHRTLALLAVAAVTLVLLGVPGPDAEAEGGGFCGIPIVGMVCDPNELIWISPLAGLAWKALDAINPANFLELWAKSCSQAVVKLLDFVQSSTRTQITPAFDQPWWREQYAVSFGLSLIVLAFVMVVIAAKVGGTGTSVSGVALLRASGWRLIMVVPAIAAAPAFLYGVQQLAGALATAYADEATQQAGGAIGALMKALTKYAGDWGTLGGVVTVIFVMALIVILALVLLIELAIASWGLDIVALVLPLVMAMSVYPPWKRGLTRIVGILLGLMLLPVATYFVFWTMWSATNSLLSSPQGHAGLPLLIYLVVGLLLVDSFPLMGAWMLSMVVPEASDIDGEVRGAIAESGAAKMSPMAGRFADMAERRGKDAADGATGGSAGGSGESDRPFTGRGAGETDRSGGDEPGEQPGSGHMPGAEQDAGAAGSGAAGSGAAGGEAATGAGPAGAAVLGAQAAGNAEHAAEDHGRSRIFESSGRFGGPSDRDGAAGNGTGDGENVGGGADSYSGAGGYGGGGTGGEYRPGDRGGINRPRGGAEAGGGEAAAGPPVDDGDLDGE